MSKRILWMIITLLAAAILYYLSRFWVFDLWGREGLFGIQQLRPQGGLLGRWLRGTPLAPFELLIWVIGFFLILTGLEKAYDRFSNRDK
ncbi:MAG: hypothetical protein AB3N21_05935 [Ruegeria sp.]|uniref:hypothetical protein n=1 Tax=Ruegeria sp. TaxID=1879320 RepID=UPI00349ECC9E